MWRRITKRVPEKAVNPNVVEIEAALKDRFDSASLGVVTLEWDWLSVVGSDVFVLLKL